MAVWISGIGVARGIGIGRVQRLHGGDLEIPEYALEPGLIDAEIARFSEATERAKAQLQSVRGQIPESAPPEIVAFIDTHLLMLEDRALSDAVTGIIRSQSTNAEAALGRQRDVLVAVFERMEDPYLRTRKEDVIQVAGRILRILLKQDKGLPIRSEEPPPGPTVIVADDLMPADIILLAQQGVAGFLTEYGGPLSHTAILTRSLGIPAVVGMHGVRRLLREGETVVVDGEHGYALADPDADALAYFHVHQRRQARYQASLAKLRSRPAISRDGIRISLLANIERPDDVTEAEEAGAEGVGLYRTEFLFMNRGKAPDEQEQYQAYVSVVASMAGPITIRTLDLGADKQVDSGRSGSPTPNNPALGLRAIRLCLKDQALFRTQIRALLRASAHGDIQIMLPMICSVQEFRQAQSLIRRVQEELRSENVAMAGQVPVGAMIEIPAAALAAPWLARYARFFSIGTNDLIQYTLAIDRVDDEVNYLYDPLHPGVLQLIRMTIVAGANAGVPVAMCGEMAGDPRYTRLLLGLGLTQFSMHPSSILEIKRIVIDADVGALKREVAALLTVEDLGDMRARLDRIL